MTKKLFASFIVFGAMTFAASNTFKVQVFQDSVVEGKTLKAGEYKIMMENGNALIKQGKETIQVAAKEVTTPDKAPSTELMYQSGNNLHEIRVGGSHTGIVFDNSAAPNNSGM